MKKSAINASVYGAFLQGRGLVNAIILNVGFDQNVR